MTSSEDESSNTRDPLRLGQAFRTPNLKARYALGMIGRSAKAVVGALIVCTFAVTALVVSIARLIGVSVTPYNPIEQNVGPLFASPSFAHLFGTDLLGEDVFSRIVAATPNDFSVGLAVVGFALIVGILVGSYAAFRGGIVDEALMRLTDIFFAIPGLVLAMVIAVALRPGVTHMILALMIIWWPPYARLARGEGLKIVHQSYIEAARLSGLGHFRILFKHLVPNITVTMLVYATLDIGTVIIVYSGLAYLGLAVNPPFPDWGQMVAQYQEYLLTYPWVPLFPALIIGLGVIGFSLLGDGIRDNLEIQ